MEKNMGKSLDIYQIKHRIGSFAFSFLKFVFISCVCYLFLFPLIYLIVSAVQDPVAAMDLSVIWVPNKLTLWNFKSAIKLLNFGRAATVSILLSVFGTLATLISCAMAGYGLARFNFAEKKLAFIMVLILIIIPPQTTSMSVYLNFRFFDPLGIIGVITGTSLNLIGSPISLVLPAVFASGIRSGLAIFIFRQFFMGQPKELEEAAMIDGCGPFKTYYKVMLPLSSPAIITISVLTFVWYWNDSFFSTMFFTTDNGPLAAQIEFLRNNFLQDANNAIYSSQQQKGILAAAAILCIVPPLVLYVIIQRKFSESIERTGIVG